MKLYRFTLQPLGLVGSHWHSDTLFGQLCWMKLYRDGEDALTTFLRACSAGEPPFVLSDAVIAGMLPRPLLSQGLPVAGNLTEYAANKVRKKQKWLLESDFHKLRRGETVAVTELRAGWQSEESLHASLDRSTNRTGGDGSGGQLFSITGEYPVDESNPREFARLQIYARVADGALSELITLLTNLAATGFGRDKSIGYGQFSIVGEPELLDWDTLPGANGFISLSHYVPAENDPSDGCWKLLVKRGKFGETRAIGADNNPYKKPLLELDPGAVFRTNGAPVRPWYGRMVANISEQHRDAMQCGMTVAIPVVFQ